MPRTLIKVPVEAYEICLADYEAVLPALAKCMGATYEAGDFSKAHQMFVDSGMEEAVWLLQGANASLRVRFEAHEDYLFSTLQGAGSEFQQGQKLLWEAYRAQGGNPNAQKEP
ncbi:MAG: hypothetical protein IPK13_27405 [Deltaproteobacteria bacterium]|nr:hypothetical protein [Deltaproteobacteria bacterium]